jgi:hypothetical protein
MYAEIYDKWECDSGHEATADLAQTCQLALIIQSGKQTITVIKLEKY